MRIIIAIFICITIYCIQEYVYRKRWMDALKLELGFDEEYIYAGNKGHITEVVYNDKWLPLTAFHVKFSTSRTFRFVDDDNCALTDNYHRHDGFSILSHEKITRRLEFTSSKRGYYRLSKVSIIAMDLFMTHSYARALPDTSYIYVLPARRKLKSIDAMCHQMIGEMSAHKGLIDDPYTFKGIRSYVVGDPMKSINWKASARTGDLAVNVFEKEAEQRVCVMLNMDTHTMIRQDELQEYLIELAGTIAAFFSSKGIPTSFATNGEDVITGKDVYISYGATREHMLAIDKQLARLTKKKESGKFSLCVDNVLRKKDQEVFYVVVSSYCKADIIADMDRLSRDGAGVYMIVPNYPGAKVDISRSYIHKLEVAFDETRA